MNKNKLARNLFRTSYRADLSSKQTYKTNTVVFLRHGESTWNLEKRFTGWCDVPLTNNGEHDAMDAGTLIGSRGLEFDVAFTSNLERAWRTCAMALASAGQSNVETIRSWRLNERHYGLLQGHAKDSPDLTSIFGEQQLIEWRRSYHDTPPSLDDTDIIQNMNESVLRVSRDNLGIKVHEDDGRYPRAESLKDCEARAYGYWNHMIAPRVQNGERVLIVAHANTIRALVRAIDDISEENIAKLKIPNGIPLVYTLDHNLKPVETLTDDIGFQAKYLVSAKNHSKLMEYERCVRKKLASLFEFLDVDGDGRITPDCLSNGLIRLSTRDSPNTPCEFEVEELLRAIPSADESGGVNLKAFLESEATLLPELSRLRLLR